MTWLDLFALLNAVCSALLGGAAVSYARFAWTHGNGLRRFMRWLAPLWALVAFWQSAVWVTVAIDPGFPSVKYSRPVGWLVFLIPALILFFSLAEDTEHRAQERQAEKVIADITERLGRG